MARYIEPLRFLSAEGAKHHKRLLLPENAICVVCIGATIGKVCMTIHPSFTNQQVNSVIVDEQEHDPHFIYHLFTTLRDRFKSHAGGSATPILNKTAFSEIEISVPPLPAQQRIASILSAYDDLIENCERRIRVLDEMARALYREWFVLFRYPGHEETPLVDSPLGRIPKGWHVDRLGNVIELNYGKALKAENRLGGAIPVFASSGLVGWHDQALASGPGIILGRKGNVGSIFWCESDFFVIDTAYFVTSRLPLRFVFFDLHGKNFINGDAAVPGLSRPQAYALETVIPPLPVLNRFSDIVSGILSPAAVLRRQAENLRKTRDLLLPRLLSGQLNPS